MPRRIKPVKHVPFELKDACRTKRRYPSQLAAERAADTQMLEKPGLELRAYKCPICAGWHLTRRPEA